MNKIILDIIKKEHVCEIFNSIQGEGFEIGYPMTFIRFNKCNKKCSFCDTKFDFTYTKEKHDYLLDRILFTGGEPFLFCEDLENAIKFFKGEKKLFGETNGSIFNQFVAKNIIWTISPKSTEDIDNCLSLLYENPKSTIKLIYGMKNFGTFFTHFNKYYHDRICIQPMTFGNTYDNLQECIDFCAKENVMISPRIHILWGLK